MNDKSAQRSLVIWIAFAIVLLGGAAGQQVRCADLDLPDVVFKEPEDMWVPGALLIQDSHDTNLLVRVILHPRVPEYNSDVALFRLIELKGLPGAERIIAQKILRGGPQVDKVRAKNLSVIFSDRCLTLGWVAVNRGTMPVEDAVRLLLKFQKAIKEKESWSNAFKSVAYKDGSEKSEQLMSNGGTFHVSRAKNEVFPGNFKTRHPPMKQIMPLNKCDYVIVDEFMSAEDKRFREAFGDRVSVDTGDRKSLYIVLDLYDPKAK